MLKHALVAAAILWTGAASAVAQEYVVTGARAERYRELQIPNVYMERRADFAIISLVVRSDTRDLSQRLEEIRSALRGLESRARGGGVTLAIVDDDVGIVRDFSMASVEELIRGDRRPDTSTITIRLRTPVGANDSLDEINERVAAFVRNATKPGRIEMETGDMELTLVRPQQYREPLLTQITADGRRVAEMLGAGYGIELRGLERQIAWQRSGELDLTLFIPYELAAAPR